MTLVTQHADSHTLAESLQPLWIARYQLWIRSRVPLVLPAGDSASYEKDGYAGSAWGE
jgi:hypothetical protein